MPGGLQPLFDTVVSMLQHFCMRQCCYQLFQSCLSWVLSWGAPLSPLRGSLCVEQACDALRLEGT